MPSKKRAAASTVVRECPICMVNWGSVGAHRIVSLACGHLFGESCVVKWVKVCSMCVDRQWCGCGVLSVWRASCEDLWSPLFGINCRQVQKRCPQCNQSAKVKDVRPVYVPTITAMDTTALAELEAKLDSEKSAKIKARQH